MAETRHATDPISGQRVEIRNDLTRRLRGQYANGPTMPSGEPEFGWRQFGEGVPIQIEAAEEIERLRDALATIADPANKANFRAQVFAKSIIDPELTPIT